MKIYRESKVLQDVRCIKEKMSEEASVVGPEKFYLALNGAAARFTAKHRTRKRSHPRR
jgi:hypothetical protein